MPDNKLKINYSQATKKLLNVLLKRQREVVSRRFGLGKPAAETLEAIGKSYKITRERVRQIENAAINQIKASSQFGELEGFIAACKNHINLCGGLRNETVLFSELAFNPRDRAHLNFLLTLGEPFQRMPDSKRSHAFWFCEKSAPSMSEKVLKSLVEKMEKRGTPLTQEEFRTLCRKDLPQILGAKIDDRAMESHLAVSKEIMRGPFGHHGLRHWPEINPKSVRDKAYLVFNREQKPLHFQTVAALICGINVPKHFTAYRIPHTANTKRKGANPQTVHNELIKDNRFVLIGRGTYALAKWGYAPGVVKEIIQAVLAGSKKPLNKEDIVKEVLKQRLVKPNTILFNLNDKNLFRKVDGERYALITETA